MDTPYLTAFPLESATRLVQTVLGRESNDSPRIVKDCFNIESYALNQIVGEPAMAGQPTPARSSLMFGISNVRRRASIQELAAQAEPLLNRANHSSSGQTGQQPAANLETQAGLFSNPLLLELLVTIGRKLLEKYLGGGLI